MEQVVRAVELARKYGVSDKHLRGVLRAEWKWPRKKNDLWTFPVGSMQAAKMEDVARRLAR